MSWQQREKPVRLQCYPGVKGTAMRIAGGVLIAAGVVLVLLCVPCWAWLAAIGAALMLLGVCLIRK